MTFEPPQTKAVTRTPPSHEEVFCPLTRAQLFQPGDLHCHACRDGPERPVVAELTTVHHAAIVRGEDEQRVFVHLLRLKRGGQVADSLVHDVHHAVHDAALLRIARVDILAAFSPGQLVRRVRHLKRQIWQTTHLAVSGAWPCSRARSVAARGHVHMKSGLLVLCAMTIFTASGP